ncbi:hypothetical protein D1B31_18545 [Neobacillus notoginsengisoli]|uniref:Uncharacterized protein n=1 Tax=Neobacillus notoginsengisoli TaxID=1578198 RepID=A0A417YQ31_9BACI|nr:hypothetical protein [Neobacillus notoginsengisoli]RHW36078.1 hypothetical protein D1B31_18545 [Neobacillus notoginsengisoli]
MTFTLTIDWLVYLYWLLEHYVFVYSLELRVRSHYEYYERIAALNKDCTKSVVVPLPVKQQVDTPLQVTLTELDSKAEELVSELQLELRNTENQLVDDEVVYVMENYEPELEDEIIYSHIEDELSFNEAPEEMEIEDCIDINDFNDEDCPSAPVGYTTFASAKIADYTDGAQSWVVTVIGMEDSYIHVSDGKRAWVNLGEDANKLNNGDVVALNVIRNGKEITVENVFLLETDATSEYIIPDEEIYYNQEHQIAI